MSSVEDIKKFVIQRLTAAAEEIFGVFRQKIDEYEEEIDRQRRLLLVVRQPVIKLHRTELSEQLICKEEEVLTDQQLCNQEGNFSLDQEDPEPPQIKEEEEELCSSQEGEQLFLKQETDTFILTSVLEENVHVEDQNLDVNPVKTLDRSTVSMPVLSSVLSAPNTDLQLLSNSCHGAEIKDQKKGKCDVSGSTEDTETKHCDTDTGKKTFKCKTCGKEFKQSQYLSYHMKIHTGEKPHVCDRCGKTFSQSSYLSLHQRTHTGVKPYVCKTCGKCFSQGSHLTLHKRVHTGVKPYVCKTCGKRFSQGSSLSRHMTVHTDERPYVCAICGKALKYIITLTKHMRTHTAERPFVCKICGKGFSQSSHLSKHICIHTRERPFVCKCVEKGSIKGVP